MKTKSSMFLWLLSTFVFISMSGLIILSILNGQSFDSIPHRKQADQSVSKTFYIYEWPDSLIDAIPINFNHHRLSITVPFLQNKGAGEVVDFRRGLYHTHQYSLFLLVYQKLLVSPYRTLDPSKANLFFIPYDLGMDGSTRSSDGALVQTNCPRVKEVMERLQSSPFFHKRHGEDHFLVHSINQMMLHFATPLCTSLYELCLNCSKLSIDTYSEETYPYLASVPHMTSKWLSIPFPSDHHFGAGTDRSWSRQAAHLSWEEHLFQRPHALCFMGSLQVTARKQKELRQALVRECKSRNKADCLLVGLSSHESIGERTSSSSSGVKNDSSSRPYDISRLCLMPGGDFPTRKGFLDAMLSGCVPVTFQLASAQEQWPLHWISRENAMRCTVYIPRESAMRDMSATFTRLIVLSSDQAIMTDKLRTIAELAHRFQYSLPDEHVDNDDALSVVLSTLLNK